MWYRVACLAAIAVLAACETEIDRATGETQTRLTLPFTEANRARHEEQWQQCIAFRSESFCERRVPGGRPAGARASAWGEDDDYPQYRRRDP